MSDEISIRLDPLFILFLLFFALKLFGMITWSWWWVTAPLWMPVALLFGIGAMCGAVVVVVFIFVAVIAGFSCLLGR
jgi:hypothetical protein